MRLLDKAGVVEDFAEGVRILDQRAEDLVAELKSLVVADHDLDAQGPGPGLHHVDGLRMAVRRDEEDVPARFERVAQGHRFRGGGGFVEQRGVGDIQPGQVNDHRLEVQQRFEAALGDFGLVRRVGGVPAGVLQHVALDDRRRDAVVVAHADIGAEDLVLRGDFLQGGQHFVLAAGGGELERTPQPNLRRHRFLDQRIEARIAEQAQHLPGFFRARPDVAARELVRVWRQTGPAGIRRCCGIPRYGQILVGCVRNRHPGKVRAATRKSSGISVGAVLEACRAGSVAYHSVDVYT